MVRLDDEARARLLALVSEGYPHETCGTLVGRRVDATTVVERIDQARNLNTERAHDRYQLDPDDFVASDMAARDAGLEIVGIWHSHPDHPARPSETDRAAAWEGYSYVIASVGAQGVVDLRSWLLDASQQFVEEPIESNELAPGN